MRNTSRHSPAGRNGFTLTEIVLAMTILSIVVTVLAGVFVSNGDIFSFLVRSGDDVGEMKLAVKRISLELKSIRDRTSVQSATSSGMEFTTSRGESVRIEYDPLAGELTLNGHVLAGRLASFGFRYFDAQENPLGSPRTQPDTNIWSIEVALSMRGPSGPMIVARAHPRNFL
jgi:prepilin-type N-terminal cleavage/methylation domain-containing protein